MALGNGENINLDSTELSLMDCGIQSMSDVPLGPHLQSLNLHSNYIQCIQGLERMLSLHHLDLSANQIARISGLDSLVSLKTLNLSCNLITVVEGLSSLRSLVKLNLSYNQIEDVSGLRSLGGNEYRLAHLELHGNRLRSLSHLQSSLTHCTSLRHLVLSQDGSSNPLCHQEGYQAELMTTLSHLLTLNGVDRHGSHIVMSDRLTDVPELETYLDFLLSGGSANVSTSSDAPQVQLKTPKIDEMLEKFRLKGFDTVQSSITVSSTDTGSNPGSKAATPGKRRQPDGRQSQVKPGNPALDQEDRLAELEKEIKRLQFTQLNSHGNFVHSPSTTTPTFGDTIGTDEEMEPVRECISAGEKLQKAQFKKSNLGTTSHIQEHQIRNTQVRKQKSRIVRDSKDSMKRKTRGIDDASSSSPAASHHGRQQDGKERQQREELQATYVQLLQELERERERRWKAEQAARRLADHVTQIQTKQQEESEMKVTALDATSRLKEAVMNERETKLRLQDQLTNLQAKVEELEKQLNRARKAEDANREAARTLEETLAAQEREILQQQAHEAKRLHESELKSAALSREVDLLRGNVQTQKGQIHQLQELLAAREQQHRQELSERYRLDSKELREVLQEKVQVVEKRHQQELSTCQEKIDSLGRQYNDLEDEFRLALQIEENKFREVQAVYERTRAENSENKQLLLAAQKKDENTSTLLSELTSLVKEQKGRLSELSRAKQEQAIHFRERIETLEASNEEARKRMIQFELLKQEKTRLEATVHAQESVIQGLKAERRLWGQELAQQGASLSQDRGRLEIKIDTLEQEVISVKKQLEKETDLVKIKTKMVDDQTETIKKLKEGVLERDEKIKEAREEALSIQRSLEDQLSDEKAAHQDLQEMLEGMRSRKNELKQQVAALQSELDSSQHSYQQLNSRWREKSELISELERQVANMTTSWSEKEKKLMEERDKALEAARLAIEKMREMDDGFRKQLEAAEKSHREELACITQEKQREVDLAEEKVMLVEEEMRELLRETELSKRTMEEKVKRMTQALGDLQSDLL